MGPWVTAVWEERCNARRRPSTRKVGIGSGADRIPDWRAEMWKTEITKVDKGKIFVRGYDLTELMESLSFGDLVLLMTTGKMPYLHQGGEGPGA